MRAAKELILQLGNFDSEPASMRLLLSTINATADDELTQLRPVSRTRLMRRVLDLSSFGGLVECCRAGLHHTRSL